MGAGNHPRTRKGRERGPRHGGKGHHGKSHDPHPGRAYPPNAPRLPGAHPPTQTAEASIGRRTDHTSAHPPATGNHTGNGGHTYTRRTGHTHRGSGRERRRTVHHHALTARRRPQPPQGPSHRHQKRTKARPQRPELGTETPRGHWDEGTGPQGGQPHRPSRGRLTRPTSPSGTPKPPQHGPSETPTPNRTPQPPASHTPARTPHHDTGQADLQ